MTEKEFLKKYDSNRYEKPSVTTDILMITTDKNLDSLEILLIKRRGHPFQNCWAIPGGFVNMNESLLEGANRELFEETHIKDVYLEQLYTFGDVGRDPRTRVITVAYLALLENSKKRVAIAGDDAKEAVWFKILKGEKGYYLQDESTLNKVRFDELAFDHAKIIKMAIDRLKNKVEYTDIAFELLPKHFTLYQVQKVFELLLWKSVHKSNFRRIIVDRLVYDDKQITIRKDVRPAASYHLAKQKSKY